MSQAHAVVLIPGFFGFGRFGDFSYFADRCVATLRAALQQRLGMDVPVVALNTDPTGSLEARQAVLMHGLRRVDAFLGGVETFHLVGHSVGGVDAALLLSEYPLQDDTTWRWQDSTGVRNRLGTVTTLAAPIYGTSLALCPAAGIVQHPWNIGGLWEAGQLVAHAAALIVSRRLSLDALAGALASRSLAAHFIWQLLTQDTLVSALEPDAMVALQERHAPQLPVPLLQYVTVTPKVPVSAEGLDRFFMTMRGFLEDYSERCAARFSEQQARLSTGHVPVLASPTAVVPVFERKSSDGVVNSVMQVSLAPTARLKRIVVADHADVIGHYDQKDPTGPGLLVDGFFRSGSGFGDHEFFALYEDMADGIAEGVHESSGARSSLRG